MSSHANISVFVPHIGCPNRCSFCDQIHITGTATVPTAEDVKNAVRTAIGKKGYNSANTELAFFGGSFTAIDTDYRRQLLGAAFEFVKKGDICGIRISTRPDAIDKKILEELSSYGVTSIELGAQSMDDEVLMKNLRGHTAEHVRTAAELIKQSGFELGLQMMTGLYADDDEKDINTARELAKLNPETVRIYPTIVFKNTYLEKLLKSGEYTPQTVEGAARLCAYLKRFFEQEGITVIRTGLHSIDEEAYAAGPWHPAFGELCENERYFAEMLSALKKKPKGDYTVLVASGCVSKAAGQRQVNLLKLQKLGYNCHIKENESLLKYNVKIKEFKKENKKGGRL